MQIFQFHQKDAFLDLKIVTDHLTHLLGHHPSHVPPAQEEHEGGWGGGLLGALPVVLDLEDVLPHLQELAAGGPHSQRGAAEPRTETDEGTV